MRDCCFVWNVYLRDYPNPYLYTHAGPNGDTGSFVCACLRRCRLSSIPLLLFFFHVLM